MSCQPLFPTSFFYISFATKGSRTFLFGESSLVYPSIDGSTAADDSDKVVRVLAVIGLRDFCLTRSAGHRYAAVGTRIVGIAVEHNGIVYGLFLSTIRQGLFYVPAILLLPRLLGINGIFLSQPAADALTILVCILSIKNRKVSSRPRYLSCSTISAGQGFVQRLLDALQIQTVLPSLKPMCTLIYSTSVFLSKLPSPFR